MATYNRKAPCSEKQGACSGAEAVLENRSHSALDYGVTAQVPRM
jgi:hypothetical protein